jgi:23S rRNA (uracil1939-C5)-methyltransferase
MAEDLAPYDAAIIDPPRAGAEAQVRELAASGVAQIGFVSCNPVTFARDAKTLTDGGYRLDWVQVVDQFRWSPHVELAASFTRPHM